MPQTPTASEIRQQFIDYFKDRCAHTVVPSSPVVPHDDPTLLFANAGMNQFKPYFLGTEKPPYPRAVDTQKCIRAGGKHNDLEDVGKDTYHHTFFEMLGNWSFGDYFKKEAIGWAWDLLVNVWKIDKDRLHATYFEGDAAEGLEPDHEARDLWLKYLPASQVHPGNKKDNFWEMGDTGPCGPCSELHYDSRKPTDSIRGLSGLPPAPVNVDNQDDVIEIWNLVFIQYNRSTDKKLTPLPAQHVDTGMGFERIVRVLQGKQSNYDTDVFTPLFEAIQKVTGAKPYTGGGGGAGTMEDHTDIAYRVLADHVRCLTFALTDGAVPSNEKRGYVLRSILRRAMFYGRYQLGVDLPDPFLYKLVDSVVSLMSEAFPELKKDSAHVTKIIREEEESFGRTIDRGIRLERVAATDALESRLRVEGKFVDSAPSDWETCGQNWEDTFSKWTYKDERIKTPSTEAMLVKEADGYVLINVPRDPTLFSDNVRRFCDIPPCITGEDAFQLHDTYGFPIGLTNLIAEQRGMTVDVAGFEKLMEEARERSRAGGGGGDSRQSLVEHVQKGDLPVTEFVGYEHTELSAIETPLHVFRVGNNCGLYKVAEKVSTGKPCAVVVGKTPFYAEAGGQVGDVGVIQVQAPEGGGARVNVTDTIKIGDITFHLGEVVAGTLVPDAHAKVALAVDRGRRAKIMSNHTTTHVMNRALRDLVNPDTRQKGSLVDEQKLRFDFSHKSALTLDELEKVEKQVNADIASDLPVYAVEAAQEEALKIKGLRAVFGEKYPPRVRVVSIGVPIEDLLATPDSSQWSSISIEFCGGTHLSKTGDAEGFVILSEDAVAKGVRRITALTGSAAHQAEANAQGLLNRLEAIKSAGDEASLAGDLAKLTTEIGEATLPAIARAQLRDGMAKLQELAKKIEKQKSKDSAGQVVETARQLAEQLSGEVIVTAIEGADANALRTAMDVIRKKHPQSALLLAGSAGDDKVALMASVPKDKIGKGLKAGDWVKAAAKIVGGGGGGRPDTAQAGGKEPAKIPQALDAAKSFALEKLD